MDKPVDVLVIAPTVSEFRVCEKVLYAEWVGDSASGYTYSFSSNAIQDIPIGDGHFPEFKIRVVGDLTVGLFLIGGQGNLNAALKCYELLDVYRPKAVFLTGIAAGKSPDVDSRGNTIRSKVKIGDVICNDYLVYSSFGKTSDGVPAPQGAPKQVLAAGLAQVEEVRKETEEIRKEKEKEIEDRRFYEFKYRKPRYDVIPNSFITGAIKRIIDADRLPTNNNETWQALAKHVFEQFNSTPEKETLPELKNVSSRWTPDYHSHSSGGTEDVRVAVNGQSKPHFVDVASGEMVIASTAFQNQLREEVKREQGVDVTIQAFEMEAYGVARICHEKKIPFVTVRGISDTGDERKDGVDKDADHLAAACLGAAYTRRIICNRNVQGTLTQAKRPTDEVINATPPARCLDPNVGSGCPYFPPYQCLDNFQEQAKIDNASEIKLVRVYEQLGLHDYSVFLSKLFGAGQKKEFNAKYHVLLLYPYLAEDTFALCKDAGINVPEGNLSLRDQAAWLRDNYKEVLGTFGHFAAIENYARQAKGSHVRVDRIIVGKETTLNDDRGAVYEALLDGANSAVQTFFVSKSWQSAEDWNLDDIVLVKTVSGAGRVGEKGQIQVDEMPTAFRYVARSKMLVVRGWRCTAAGGRNAAGEGNDFPTVVVRRWFEESEKSHEAAWSNFATRLFR